MADPLPHLRASAPLLFLSFVLVSSSARAEPPRRVVGTVPAAVARARLLEPADRELPLTRMILVLTPDRERLERLLADQQDPASPRYHRWLTPQEFGALFGPAKAELDALVGWLTDQGFEVEGPTPGRTAILFSGRVHQVETAFSTRINTYGSEEGSFLANAVPPSLPAVLSGRVAGILSLDGLPKRMPLHREATYTVGSRNYLGPSDLHRIYNVEPLLAGGLDGSGRTIAILAKTNLRPDDSPYFRQVFGLPANPPQVVLNGPDPGTSSYGNLLESTLDVQYAGGLAPKATVLLVASMSTPTTDGVDLSALYTVNQNLGDVISFSYGTCEKNLGAVDTAFYFNVWAQAAAQGQSAFVASGDSGAAACSSPFAPVGTSLAVNGLASSPYDTAVGGTLFDDAQNPSLYWDTTNDPATRRSAKSYIPETTWNESAIMPFGSGLLASGGGRSESFAKPAWQAGPGVPADSRRDLPDVSLAASGRNAYAIVVNHTPTVEGFVFVSGTSAGAPSFAGIAALLCQKLGGRQGNLNPRLYALGKAQYEGTGAQVFHDVTTGSNSVPGVVGFSAGVGYDLATGLGSVDAAALGAAFPTAPPEDAAFSLLVSPAVLSLPKGATASVTLRLAAAPGFDLTGSLAMGPLPPGVSGTFVPARQGSSGTDGIASTGVPGVLVITTSSGTKPGDYAIPLSAQVGTTTAQAVLRLSVAVFGAITLEEVPVPTPEGHPVEIAAGPDDNVWFTQSSPAGGIGRITPSGTLTQFPVPSPGSDPFGIASGPDGNLWFTEASGNNIGRIAPSGAALEVSVPTADAVPSGIATGPDGNLWFTESAGNRIGRMTPGAGITEFLVPTPSSSPSGITSGPDGNLWFTERTGNRIGRITPGGTFAEFPIPSADTLPTSIALGPDGNLWFSQAAAGIGRISPSGTITEFPIPTPSGTPSGITSGPDGNLWFTEDTGNRIGRITPVGTVAEVPLPVPGSRPLAITAQGGGLWFTEYLGNRIGHVTLSIPTRLDCPLGASPAGDPLSRGFHLTGYPGGNIQQVTLSFSAAVGGRYALSLTARAGTFDGPLLGRAMASATLTGSPSSFVPVTFGFSAPGVVVAAGSTVAFTMTQASGPSSVLFDTANQGTCAVVETEDAAPPLSTIRKNGIVVRMAGDPASAYGDLDQSGVRDVFDVVTLASAIVGNLQSGAAPFTTSRYLADLNRDDEVDLFDLVLLQAFIVGNVPGLPQ